MDNGACGHHCRIDGYYGAGGCEPFAGAGFKGDAGCGYAGTECVGDGNAGSLIPGPA